MNLRKLQFLFCASGMDVKIGERANLGVALKIGSDRYGYPHYQILLLVNYESKF